MRRIMEIIVLVAFIGAGLLLVLGKISLPAPNIDLAALLPSGAAEGLSLQCDSCALECPFASGESGGRPGIDIIPPAVDGDLHNSDAIPREHAWLREMPLSGGYLVGVREGEAEARGRLWAEIFTSSSLEDTVSWYREHLMASGWQPLKTHAGLVPDGVFLAFTSEGSTLNLLIEGDEKGAKVFVDHSLPN